MPMWLLLRRLRVDPCGKVTDLEAATPADRPERDMLCSVLDSEPCRMEIANASHASVQLVWFSYEGASAQPSGRTCYRFSTVEVRAVADVKAWVDQHATQGGVTAYYYALAHAHHGCGAVLGHRGASRRSMYACCVPTTSSSQCMRRRAGSAVAAGTVRPGTAYQLQTWKASPSCSSTLCTPFCVSALGLPQAEPRTLTRTLLSSLCQLCVCEQLHTLGLAS